MNKACIYKILFTWTLGTCFGQTVAHAQTTFVDRFDDPAYTAANWTIESGSWRVKGGTYDQDGPRSDENFSTVFTRTFTNFTLDCDLTYLGIAGLVVREDPKAMTGLTLVASSATGQLYFTVRKGTGFSDILSTAPLNAAFGSNLHLTLTAQGNNFTAVATSLDTPGTVLGSVSLNGSPRVQDLMTGRVGVYETNNRPPAYSFTGFDNFAVSVPEPTTWTLGLVGTAGLLWLGGRRRTVATPLA